MSISKHDRGLRRFGVLALSLSAGCFLLPLTAAAQDVTATKALAWHCTQEMDAAFHVLCVPRIAETGSPATPDAPPGVSLNLMPVAQRGDSEVMSADAWRIPLHVRPSDPAFVTTLLKSVLCGKRAACDVSYDTVRREGRPASTVAIR